MDEDQSWMDYGACLGIDPDIFFPEKDGESQQKVKIAKTVCKHCPVKQECLNHAITNHENFGVWGGMTTRERERERKRRRFLDGSMG